MPYSTENASESCRYSAAPTSLFLSSTGHVNWPRSTAEPSSSHRDAADPQLHLSFSLSQRSIKLQEASLLSIGGDLRLESM